MTDLPRRAMLEAIQVLEQVMAWELAPARWELIGNLFTALEAALAAQDIEAITTTTAELEMVGPVRIVRMGSAEQTPPSAPLQDRANELIHTLLRLSGTGNSSGMDGDG